MTPAFGRIANIATAGLPQAHPAAKAFKVGDHVTWNSEAGRVSGRIVRVHRKYVIHSGYVHRASREAVRHPERQDRARRPAQGGGTADRAAVMSAPATRD